MAQGTPITFIWKAQIQIGISPYFRLVSFGKISYVKQRMYDIASGFIAIKDFYPPHTHTNIYIYIYIIFKNPSTPARYDTKVNF